MLFFFFQAEDGIRDHCVTGVQTCALPICAFESAARQHLQGELGERPARAGPDGIQRRSEERRVGKESRSSIIVIAIFLLIAFVVLSRCSDKAHSRSTLASIPAIAR